MVALQLTALTDGCGIQVLVGAPGMTVSAMREVLVAYVKDNVLSS
jgi:hypothetical protein